MWKIKVRTLLKMFDKKNPLLNIKPNKIIKNKYKDYLLLLDGQDCIWLYNIITGKNMTEKEFGLKTKNPEEFVNLKQINPEIALECNIDYDFWYEGLYYDYKQNNNHNMRVKNITNANIFINKKIIERLNNEFTYYKENKSKDDEYYSNKYSEDESPKKN